MTGCTTNRNGDLSIVSRGTACFASRAGSSTHAGQIRLSELVLPALSICSASTSRDIVIANSRAFSAIELQSTIGTITMGSRKFSRLQLAGGRNFSFDSSIMAADREHQADQRRQQAHPIQAPATNLTTAMTTTVTAVLAAPSAFTAIFRHRAALLTLPPMRDHTALRQGESQKCSDREQRNQPVGNAVEHDQQDFPETIARSQMPSE